MMKIPALLTAVAISLAVWVGPPHTIEGCAEGLRRAKATHTLGVIHECDGLTKEQQDEAVRRASS
jgi:hypothetical protein